MITVPSFWKSITGLEHYDGWCWYARTFNIEKHEKLNLAFYAIDDNAVVWRNRKMIDSHTDFTEPFVLRTSGVIRDGDNTIVLQVIDNGNSGGIYKSVALKQDKQGNAKEHPVLTGKKLFSRK